MQLKKISKIGFITMSVITITNSINLVSFASENIKTSNYKSKIVNEKIINDDNITREELIEFYKVNGVDNSTIEKILNKLENGETPDSLNNKKRNTYKSVRLGENKEKRVYPDGSISIIEIEEGNYIDGIVKEGDFRGITVGRPVTGSGYRSYIGTKVSYTSGLMNMSYYADYTFVQGGSDILERVYDKRVSTYGGTYSVETFGVIRRNEVAGMPAQGRLEIQYKMSGGATSDKNYYLDLRVGNDRVW